MKSISLLDHSGNHMGKLILAFLTSPAFSFTRNSALADTVKDKELAMRALAAMQYSVGGGAIVNVTDSPGANFLPVGT